MGPEMLAAASGAAGGLIKTVGSLFGGRKRRKEQKAAKKEYNEQKGLYKKLDTSNLWSDLDNNMLDLTVNQQAAQFQVEQGDQAIVDTMSQFRNAAGPSGFGALAQSMMMQRQKNVVSASLDIGRQEQQNAMAAAQTQQQMQAQEVQGAMASRDLEYEKTETLLGMAGQRLAGANKARADATQATIGGLSEMVGGAASAGLEMGLFDKKIK